MLEIKFKYRDKISYPRWNEQCCSVSSLKECKRIYGLGVDCEYRIIAIKDENGYDGLNAAKNLCYAVFDDAVSDDIREKFISDAGEILATATFKKIYRAFEGDVRIIVERDGNEYRYSVNTTNGNMEEK